MKHKQNKAFWQRMFAMALCLVLVAALMSGCSSGNIGRNESAAESPAAPGGVQGEWGMPEPAPDRGDGWAKDENIAPTAPPAPNAPNISAEKLIRRVYLSGETRAFEDALNGIRNAVNAAGGYVENASEQGKKPENYYDSGRRASMVVRIPTEKLDAFLATAGSLIDVISESSNVENVTTQYYDFEARKQSYQIQLQRLESILTEASELADVLALETEIARVRYELESIETTLRNLDNQVSYSTVSIDFYELTGFERPQATDQSLGERISDAFSQAISDAGEWIKDTIVWFSANFISLIVLAAAIVVAVQLIKRYNKRHGYVGKQRKAKVQKPEIQQPEPPEQPKNDGE